MSNEYKTPIKPIKIKKIGLNSISSNILLKYKKNLQSEREDVLYMASQSDPIFNRYPNLIIVNNFSMINNTNRTVAKFTENGSTIELSSDCVTNLLGQKNYDTIFNAISSVFNQTLKLDAIMGLLTKGDKNIYEKSVKNKSISRCSQTDESHIIKFKQAPRRRMRCSTYAVLDNIDSLTTDQKQSHKQLNSKPHTDIANNLIDTKDFLCDDDSNWDTLSLNSNLIPNSVLNPQECLNSLNYSIQVECKTRLKLIDGSMIELQTKPEDLFHLATPENLRGLNFEEQKKLLIHQAYLHWKHCLEINAEGNLPLHVAVLENDVYLLKKHCIVMKSHQESLDIPGAGGLSALQLSIHANLPKCTYILLEFGAKVTQTDSECMTLLHYAAQSSLECVKEILGYCRKYPRRILSEKEGLWTHELEFQTDEEISTHLIHEFCSVFDDEGFTPLMIACRKGCVSIVNELVQAAPKTVNMKSPLSGNTALHECISAAYSEAQESDNKSKITKSYLDSIAALSKYGGEPNIANDAGITVTMLLGENIEMSEALSTRFNQEQQTCNSFMLVKHDDNIKVEPIKFTKQAKIRNRRNNEHTIHTQETETKHDAASKKDTEKTESNKSNVVILENLHIAPDILKAGQVVQRRAIKVSDISKFNSVKLIPKCINFKPNVPSKQNDILKNIIPVIIKPNNILLKDKIVSYAAIKTDNMVKKKSGETKKIVIDINNIQKKENSRKRRHPDET